jgi:ubiquinone/menaquinone biosynthesis C-methylase UbiE
VKPRFLSQRRARDFYDRFGSKQDSQAFYEDDALAALVRHGRLSDAMQVLEVGCGTGRFAGELIDRHLPGSARYYGCDVSTTMVRLAARRLRGWRRRALVVQAAALDGLPFPDGRFDRFVSTYVFDLLPADGIARALREAHRVLAPGGLVCLVGITPGTTWPSRLVMSVWSFLQRLSPALVGGCRPVDLRQVLPSSEWAVVHREVVVSFAVASEVLVASPRPG